MYKTLEQIREKVEDIEDLNDQIARLSVTYKSQNYDGMPKGRGGDGIASKIDDKEYIEKRRKMLIAEKEELEEKVSEALEMMPTNLYSFCTYYFLKAFSVEETCKIIEREESTFYRYKRKVRKMLGE